MKVEKLKDPINARLNTKPKNRRCFSVTLLGTSANNEDGKRLIFLGRPLPAIMDPHGTWRRVIVEKVPSRKLFYRRKVADKPGDYREVPLFGFLPGGAHLEGKIAA